MCDASSVVSGPRRQPAPTWRLVRLGAAALAVLSMALAGSGQALRAQAVSRHVLIISIDGLKPATYTSPGPAKIPTLRKLAQEGAWADGVIGVLPTVTYPSHTTMITGVLPSVHGIPNNLIFDPEN